MPVSTMGKLIDAQTLLAVRRKLKADITAIVKSSVGGELPVIVRDLVPSDFQLAVGVNTYTLRTSFLGPGVVGAVNTFSALTGIAGAVNRTLDNNEAWGIYGISFITPGLLTLRELRFFVGAAQLIGQVRVTETLVDTDLSTVFIDPPILYKPLEIVAIQGMYTGATVVNTEEYELLGYVAEPAGKHVSPRETPASR